MIAGAELVEVLESRLALLEEANAALQRDLKRCIVALQECVDGELDAGFRASILLDALRAGGDNVPS